MNSFASALLRDLYQVISGIPHYRFYLKLTREYLDDLAAPAYLPFIHFSSKIAVQRGTPCEWASFHPWFKQYSPFGLEADLEPTFPDLFVPIGKNRHWDRHAKHVVKTSKGFFLYRCLRYLNYSRDQAASIASHDEYWGWETVNDVVRCPVAISLPVLGTKEHAAGQTNMLPGVSTDDLLETLTHRAGNKRDRVLKTLAKMRSAGHADLAAENDRDLRLLDELIASLSNAQTANLIG